MSKVKGEKVTESEREVSKGYCLRLKDQQHLFPKDEENK